MNVTELLQLDIEHIKNVDWKQVQKDVIQRKDTLVIAILVIVTPATCLYIYSQKSKEAKAMSQAITLYERKLTALEGLQAAKKELAEYIAQFPDPIPNDELIDEISRMAINNNIQILTISPLQQSADSNYTLTTVTLSVIAANISDMRSFFETIENSPYPLRIDGWSVRIDSPLTYDPEQANSIRSSIDIASVSVKK